MVFSKPVPKLWSRCSDCHRALWQILDLSSDFSVLGLGQTGVISCWKGNSGEGWWRNLDRISERNCSFWKEMPGNAIIHALCTRTHIIIINNTLYIFTLVAEQRSELSPTLLAYLRSRSSANTDLCEAWTSGSLMGWQSCLPFSSR